MSEALIGRTLGKYQVLEKLGQGGMGMVFKALQPSLNRTVAIKVLPAQLAMDPEFVQRFRQEAQVIASLQHEAIVHVYDIDEAVLPSGERIYFIVMELVEGQTLRQWVGRGRALPPHEVQRIGCELARALEYAHRRGIVHRDIKTANAMITLDSKVKLMDFGIAKSAGGIRTMTGSLLGTPEYMAPEQARSGKVSPQSDIYSLGVLLYEIATGRLPFTGDEPFAVALQHLSEEPPRPREVNAGVPPWLERIILKAMAKEPGERHGSASELMNELAAGGRDEPALAATIAADPQAPTLVSNPAPPGWPGASSSSVAPTWPAGSAVGDQMPTTPIGAVRFGASPPGAQQPPTPPGSFPPASGASGAGSAPGVAWGAAGAYVPPTPPVGPWPPASPPPGQTLTQSSPPPPPLPNPESAAWGVPPQAPSPTTFGTPSSSSRGGIKTGVLVAALLVLTAIGVVLGAYWSRSGKVEIERETSLPQDPSEPPPAPTGKVETSGNQGREIPGEDVADEGATVTREKDPEPAQPPSRESGPGAGELWSQAFRLKEEKKYHSLREVLDRLMAKDPDYGQAREWRKKVDGWIESRESDIRGEADDLLDNLVEALEDRDRAAIAELWGDEQGPATDALLGRLWDLGPRLKFRARYQNFKCWDDRGDFVAIITLADRNGRKLREINWRGAMVDDQNGPRFTVPLR